METTIHIIDVDKIGSATSPLGLSKDRRGHCMVHVIRAPVTWSWCER